MKDMEIERKYLLRPCSPRKFLHSRGLRYHKFFIQQYYLPEQEGHYVRYRRKNDNYYRTVKSGEGLVRKEYETRVSREEFESYLPEHVGIIIEKDRYVFEYGGMTYEMDRFRRDLKGLCYLEIEFGNEAEAKRFVLPEIFAPLLVADVTLDRRFTNAHLCMTGQVPVPKERTGAKEGALFGPFDGSREAMTTIMQELAHTLEMNQKALRNHRADPEALHRFRVSLRKSRSVLELFSAHFSKKWYALHDRNLSLLMERTDVRRDIDVLLKNLPGYRALLPGKLRKGLDPIKVLLEERRSALNSEIAELSQSELLNYEIAMLAKPSFRDAMPEQPILFAALPLLHEEISVIMHRGEGLEERSKGRVYHKLRIEFKKLRYFIEVMHPVIPPKKGRKALTRIKKIQTVFGLFHDYQVQRKLLRSLKRDPMVRSRLERKALKRVIREIEVLKEKQRAVCTKAFRHFLRRRTKMEKLFFI